MGSVDCGFRLECSLLGFPQQNNGSPISLLLGSDGIDDCFRNNEQLHNLYKTVIYSFATSSFEEACDGLADYLPRLSAKGSGDDVSISALLDLELIPELTMV